MNENIKVSIICNAFNHEKYIRQTLEGFVKQITSFKFEVLIHDDASTDNTAEIIREFEREYPEIIKPIYQTENQYSKGVKISAQYHYPRARGKYVAICEGDDYWTDVSKLQKQFDLLEAHPEVDMCAHRAESVQGPNDAHRGYQGPGANNALLSAKQVIRGEGGYLPTNSLFFRAELIRNIPEFRRYLSLDYTMQIQGALRGGVLYIGEAMSVYRVCTPGSWTARTRKNGKKKREINKKIKRMLLILNKETRFKFFPDIAKVYFRALLRDVYCVFLSIRERIR